MTQAPRQPHGQHRPPPASLGPQQGVARVVYRPDCDFPQPAENALPRGGSPEAQRQAEEVREGLMVSGAEVVLSTLPPDRRERVEDAIDARMEQVTVQDRIMQEMARSRPPAGQFTSDYDPSTDSPFGARTEDTRDFGQDNWGRELPRHGPAPGPPTSGAPRNWYDEGK